LAIPALIAAAQAAASAVALGAAGATGALAVQQIAKAAGAGMDPTKVRNALQRIKLTVGDFSPTALAKIEKAQQLLNSNPKAIAVVSKILHPIIKTSLGEKLREFGITSGRGMCGGSVEFTKALKQELQMA
jgi:hypothetical protein